MTGWGFADSFVDEPASGCCADSGSGALLRQLNSGCGCAFPAASTRANSPRKHLSSISRLASDSTNSFGIGLSSFDNYGSSSPLIPDPQRDQASQSQVCPPMQWGLLKCQVRHAAEDSRKRDLALDTGQRSTEAEVGRPAECEMPVVHATKIQPVGI